MPGKRLDTNQQRFVLNLISYFRKEFEHGGPLLPLNCIQERVANALGISIQTVGSCLKKRVASPEAPPTDPPIAETPAAQSPPSAVPSARPSGSKRKATTFPYTPRKKRKTTDLPNSCKMEIRNVVYNMYAKGKNVTLATLNEQLKLQEIVDIGKSSLHILLRDIGFRFKKHDNRVALMELPNVVCRRNEFLRQYRRNKQSPMKRQVVFLDETWIFSRGASKRSWQDGTPKGVRRPKSGDGKRFIILHAGQEGGFVENASLIFATKSKLADYHGDMNAELFERWVAEKLVPNLEEPSLIVMDNAAYHSVVVEYHPTTAWTKQHIEDWLTAHNVVFEKCLFKTELLALTRLHIPPKRYKVDEYLQEHGHEVLRLPPYHCQFNAIELIWAQAKTYYDQHIGEDGYGDDKVLEMWDRALRQCTPDRWRSAVEHTDKIIEEWYQRQHVIDEVPEVIIHLGGDNSDEDDDFDDSV